MLKSVHFPLLNLCMLLIPIILCFMSHSFFLFIFLVQYCLPALPHDCICCYIKLKKLKYENLRKLVKVHNIIGTLSSLRRRLHVCLSVVHTVRPTVPWYIFYLAAVCCIASFYFFYLPVSVLISLAVRLVSRHFLLAIGQMQRNRQQPAPLYCYELTRFLLALFFFFYVLLRTWCIMTCT